MGKSMQIFRSATENSEANGKRTKEVDGFSMKLPNIENG
jgi:hypothetical protein